MTRWGEPAFPELERSCDDERRYIYSQVGGLSKLEYAAIMVIQGLCSDGCQAGCTDSMLRYNAEFAVAQAKALLSELEKEAK